MTDSRSHLVNVVATPLWGVIHGSERRVPERRTAPWLQGVPIYEMASKQRRLWLVAIFLLASLLAVPTARAHEARPAYLEIKETSPNQFSVLWRTPVLAGMRLPVVLTMPGDVKNLKEPVEQELADSLLERRWIDAGATGLAGKRIQFTGLQLTITDVLVRVEMLDGRSGQPSSTRHSRGSRLVPRKGGGEWRARICDLASNTFGAELIICCLSSG